MNLCFCFCICIFSSTHLSLTHKLFFAEIAQLAERRYRKPQVGGSKPLLGSLTRKNNPLGCFLGFWPVGFQFSANRQ